MDYYLFQRGKELKKFYSHQDAFEEFDKSTIIPRAVVRVNFKARYFKPINQNYDSFNMEQIREIKQPFYNMNLRYEA